MSCCGSGVSRSATGCSASPRISTATGRLSGLHRHKSGRSTVRFCLTFASLFAHIFFSCCSYSVHTLEQCLTCRSLFPSLSAHASAHNVGAGTVRQLQCTDCDGRLGSGKAEGWPNWGSCKLTNSQAILSFCFAFLEQF